LMSDPDPKDTGYDYKLSGRAYRFARCLTAPYGTGLTFPKAAQKKSPGDPLLQGDS